ncbi:MAG TPA: hypothetical protein V6D17_00780 [Candidatus Obscuribacterales bacterium]
MQAKSLQEMSTKVAANLHTCRQPNGRHNVSDDQYVWRPTAYVETIYGAANNLNEYPTVGGASCSYNQNGCLTGDGVWTFGYDTEDHLTLATKVGTVASFVYDPVGRKSTHEYFL